MTRRLSELRRNATAAYVGPLAAFMLLSMVPGWFRVENSAAPWYVQQPEHWWYPVQTVVCAALLLWWRQHYILRPWRASDLALAVLAAAVGIAIWVAPGWLFQHRSGAEENLATPGWWRWLGWSDRSEGFDPTLLAQHPLGQTLSLIARFARSSLVVPFVEELCWRGWLMRYCIAGDRPFTRIPFGTHRWRSYFITTACVTAIHQPEDWLAAWIWGTLVYALAVRTRSLGACVVMHAVGNLLLGFYILRTGQWGYW